MTVQTNEEEQAPLLEIEKCSAASLELEMPEASGSSKELESQSAPKFQWLQFLRYAGSGFLGCVAFLDPGNLEANVQMGVASGMTLLWWAAICCLVFGLTFQCISGRLGLVTGKDLAQHLGERYPKPARLLMWAVMEVAIVGADIQETIGSAIALSILTGGALPLWGGCIVVSVTAFLLLLLDRVGFRQLEALFAAFISVEAVCMGINFVQAKIPGDTLAKGQFIPRLSASTMPVAVASLGALVMPYNIFYQSAVVNLRPREADSDAKRRVLLQYLRLESFLVLVVAYIINLFVIAVFADGFYGVLSEDEVGLETAGDHLAVRFGDMFRTMWAVGLLASGQVATIGLTHAGQLVMTGLLNMEVKASVRMVATRCVALVPTVVLAVVFEASNTFDRAAQLLNIVQSMVLPFALLPVLHVAADGEVMGKFVSRRALTVFGGAITVMVSGVNGYMVFDAMSSAYPGSAPATTGAALIVAVYYALVAYFAVGPENLPAIRKEAGARLWQLQAWARARLGRADFTSMLEVHI